MEAMNTGNRQTELSIKYLLGDLPDDEQKLLEERFFSDNELFIDLLETEDQLIRDYLAARLGSKDKERFERHYLSTSCGREKVNLFSLLPQTETAKSIIRKTRSEVPSSHPIWIRSPLGWMRMLKPAVLIPTFAFLLIVAALGLLLLRTFEKNNETIVSAPPARQVDTGIVSSTPSVKEEELVASIELEPASDPRASATRSVTIPKPPILRPGPQTKFVVLRLKLTPPIYSQYQGRVLDKNERLAQVASESSLKPEGDKDMRYISWKLGREDLHDGDYQVELRGVTPSGETGDLSIYDLKVRDQ